MFDFFLLCVVWTVELDEHSLSFFPYTCFTNLTAWTVEGSCFLFLGMLHVHGLDVQGKSSSLSLVVLTLFLQASSMANKVAAR